MADAAANFERYSDDIRDAFLIANAEATRHTRRSVDVPHLLVALVREPTGLAGALLRRKGLSPRPTRRAVRRVLPRMWSLNLGLKLPMTSRLKAVVAHAAEHAIQQKHDSVGTGGVLLAMIRHDERIGEILRSLGIEVTSFDRELGRYLHRFMVEAPDQPLYFDDPSPGLDTPPAP